MAKASTRLRPGERLTPQRWAAAIEAISARAELSEAKFAGDTRLRRLQRMAKAVVSPGHFCQMYLPHYFRDEGSELHHLLFLLYAFASYGAVRAPRGHAKTTVGTFGYGLHQVVCGSVLRAWQEGTLQEQNPELHQAIEAARLSEARRLLRRPWKCGELGIPEHWDPEVTASMDSWLARVHEQLQADGAVPLHWDPYIQILAVTVEVATEFTSAIRDELENNPLIRADWGDLSPCYTGDWGRKRRRPASADDWESNGVRVKAFGMNGSVRGGKHGPWRPTLVLGDDLDSEESTRTEGQREANIRKVVRVLDKGLDEKRKRTYILGTPVHSDCVVCRLSERAEYSSRWTRLRFRAADEAGRILYPAKWTAEALEEERLLDEEGYGSELDDRPPVEGGHPFTEIQHYRRDDYAELALPRVMAFDPSLGKSRKSDFQALVQVRVATDGDILVDRADLWRIPSPPELISMVADRVREDKPTAKVIEAIGFQMLLLHVAGEKDVTAMDDWNTIEFQSESKELRVRSLAPRINPPKAGQPKRRAIRFPDDGSCRQLERQVLSWPQGKRDGPDALEMAVRFVDAGQSGDWGWN